MCTTASASQRAHDAAEDVVQPGEEDDAMTVTLFKMKVGIEGRRRFEVVNIRGKIQATPYKPEIHGPDEGETVPWGPSDEEKAVEQANVVKNMQGMTHRALMLFREQFESCVLMPDSVIDDNWDDPLRLYLLLRY